MNDSVSRTATIDRTTKESQVHVELDLDGTGKAQVSTGVGFYDHMLQSFARHALIDLAVHTVGDTQIDAHHTVEDTAIVLGEALREALGDKRGFAGSLTRHVFETLAFHAQIALHIRVLSGRDPHHLVEAQFKAFARALRTAVAIDPRELGVPSTKGTLS